MTGTGSQPPRLAYLSAHMRSPLDIGLAGSVKSSGSDAVLQWESRGTRYTRIVEETIVPVSPPRFVHLKTLGSSESLKSTAQRQFRGWLDYVYDLVVASWAFRVNLDSQVKSNLYLVKLQWESGGRAFVRGHVDVGLVGQIPSLREALDLSEDGMRFDAMTLSSSVLEELAPGTSSKATEQLAVAMRASANAFLSNDKMSRYRHAAAILALQRSLRSLPQEFYVESRRELLGQYAACLHEEDTFESSALLRAVEGLLSTFDGPVPKEEAKLLEQLDGTLRRIVDKTKSGAVKAVSETVIVKISRIISGGGLPSDVYAVQSHGVGDLDI